MDLTCQLSFIDLSHDKGGQRSSQMGRGIRQTHKGRNGLIVPVCINLSPALVDEREPSDVLISTEVSVQIIEVKDVACGVIPSSRWHEAALRSHKSDSLKM